MKRLLCSGPFGFVFLTLLAGSPRPEAQPLPPAPPALVTATNLFVSGQGGYHTYRIPSLLVTAGGTWLAFAEGRKGGSADHGDIDLVLRRSTDQGRSWNPLEVVWDDGANTCGNPCPVVERNSGTVWLFMTSGLLTWCGFRIAHVGGRPIETRAAPAPGPEPWKRVSPVGSQTRSSAWCRGTAASVH